MATTESVNMGSTWEPEPTAALPQKRKLSLSHDKHEPLKLAVFSGGEASLFWFDQALTAYCDNHKLGSEDVSVERVTNCTIRENPERFQSPMDLITWLINSDAYFIVSQGIWLGLIASGTKEDGWTAANIAAAIAWLQMSMANGFPCGDQLDCPVWNGDKIRYINLIPDYVIPSFQIDLLNLNCEALNKDLIKEIQRWAIDNDYEKGWFLKVPYTANGLHYNCRSYADMSSLLHAVNNAISSSLDGTLPFPYLILQPTIPNPKEYKVILHDGVFQYFHQRGKSCLRCPKPNSDAGIEVAAFATDVYNALAARTKRIILNGLVRIDIMRVQTENVSMLKVNEVEGIDSAFGSTSERNEIKTTNFLRQYWYKIISKKMKELL